MNRQKLGTAGLQGWRSKVADAVAEPVARRSRVSENDVRSVVGGVFLLLTITYLWQAVKEMLAD